MIKKLMDYNNATIKAIYYTECGEIILEFYDGNASRRLVLPIPWFYNQVFVDLVPDRLCGLYEFIDNDLISYIYNKSHTMLRADLAKHYRAVFANLVIDIVITGTLSMRDEHDNLLDCPINDEADLVNSERLSNLINIFDLITGNIEFDDNEQFVIDSELSHRFQRPIEISSMTINYDGFSLSLTASHGKKKYEIFSDKVPDFIQLADELVADDAFTKAHKCNKSLGTIYEVLASSVLKKLKHSNSDLKMLRIEDSEIPIDIVTSHPLFYREVDDSIDSKCIKLM